ncbi:MAG: helix-hairpin-helix domain-containing protein [Proteobacteria bacterium]|nr:helix-hairpin-helix domain-containing protein [Pseudomonadota bacterium]
MTKYVIKVSVACMFLLIFFDPHQAYSQEWSDFTLRSLPDTSFALVEIDKDGNKVRHFPYRDMNGSIHVDQLIYCLATFGDETWVDPKHKETARRHLEEHYYRFKLKQLKEEMTEPVNINDAGLKNLVRLPNIGPVTAVRIYEYGQTHGPFDNIEDIKKVEGIGPAIFAGIRYYIRTR